MTELSLQEAMRLADDVVSERKLTRNSPNYGDVADEILVRLECQRTSSRQEFLRYLYRITPDGE